MPGTWMMVCWPVPVLLFFKLSPLYKRLVLINVKDDVSPFPPEMKRSTHPNFVFLGIPICDKAFCSYFILEKHEEAKALQLKLEEVSAVNPHVAFSLLRQCAGFCKLAHLAHGTPPSQAISAVEAFDHNIRATFSKCTVVDTSNQAWQQAELSLSRGGLGIRSLSRHSPAAYIASLSSSGAVPLSQEHLIHAVELFNSSAYTIIIQGSQHGGGVDIPYPSKGAVQ